MLQITFRLIECMAKFKFLQVRMILFDILNALFFAVTAIELFRGSSDHKQHK
jgi:hypothetical protein